MDERKTEKRQSRDNPTTDDTGTNYETTPASEWGLGRRTFIKIATLLGVGGSALGSLSAPVAAQTASSWTEQQKLTASDTTAGDWFGQSVAVSGDSTTALVGAHHDDTDAGTLAGSVYVYKLSRGKLVETKLTASDGSPYDEFGWSVAVNGDGTTAVIGAREDDDAGSRSGSAYVYDLRRGAPVETKLTASDGQSGDQFGRSVAVSGDGTTVVVGAITDDTDIDINVGSAYVYDLSGGAPVETKLTASDGQAHDGFGRSVAVSGDGTTALVGASGNDADAGAQAGAVYVYDLSGGAPVETKLTASDGSSYDSFGWSVAVSGNGTTAFVSAIGNDNNAGAVYVYDLSGGAPVETKLTASDGQSGDQFGYSVAVSGDGTTALVGASGDDTDAGTQAGSAYVYDLSGGAPVETKLTASDGQAQGTFGYSVAVSGDGRNPRSTAFVGAPRHDTDAGSNAGSAYMFIRLNSPRR